MILKNNTFLKNIRINNITLAAQVSQLQRPLALILVAILLSKSGISTGDIGTFETILFVATTVNMLGMSTIVSSLTPIFGHSNEDEQKGNIQLVYAIVIVFNALIVSCLALFQPYSIFVITGHHELELFNILCLYILFHFPAGILDVLLMLYKEAKLLFILSFSNFLAMVLSVLFSLVFQKGIEGILYCWIGYAILKNIYLLYYFQKKGIFKKIFLNKNLAKVFIAFVIPLLLYSILGGVANNIDSWIINWFTHGDKTVFALYRYGAREVPFINAFCIGLSNVMIFQVAQNNEVGIAELKQKSTALMHKIFLLAIGFLLLSPILYPLAFSKAFLPSVPIFNIYILLTISRLIFPQTILNALKDSKAILYIGIIDLILNVVFSVILVQCLGIKGVAWGTVIAYTAEKIIIAFYLYKKYNIRVQEYCELRYFLSYAALLSAVYIVSTFMTQY